MKNQKSKPSKIKEILTVLLGLCIVIGRVLLPTELGINNTTVILEILIELAILTGVILLNKEKLAKVMKEVKKEKLGKFLKVSFILAIILIASAIVTGLIINSLGSKPVLASIISGFSEVLPVLGLISQIIIAPITEELVFRMTLRDLIHNKFLFVVVSSLLFAFIHDWFYFSAGLLQYFILGAVLSLLYLYKAKNIGQMIAAHSANNTFASIAQILPKLVA